MARVEVRALRPYEGKKLVAWLRQGRDAIAVRRAEIVLRSSQGESAAGMARELHFSGDYVRKVIHRFNTDGIPSLKARYENGGQPKALTPEHESQLVELALTPPHLTGLPFTHWSLETLRQTAIQRRLTPKVCLDTVRLSLKRHRISLQRSKTWKQSTDPEFEPKKRLSGGSTTRRKRDASK